MAQEIPILLEQSADFVQTVELDGAVVVIRITWNVRNDTGFMEFTDGDGNTINGIKIVPNWPLLRQLKGSTSIDGDFIVVRDDNTVETEITYDNLGSGQNLYYVTQEELLVWEDYYGVG
jgi:hypothetical protein